jgi:hypothetical protein
LEAVAVAVVVVQRTFEVVAVAVAVVVAQRTFEVVAVV